MTPLRINWVLARPSMSGGTKSNRLVAEAMVRRGHRVHIAFSTCPKPWPRPWRARTFLQRCHNQWRTKGKQRHQVEQSTAHLIPVPHLPIRARDVPDADVTIATWWETMHWINAWPRSKGLRAYFIRHHETHGGDIQRVRETYRMPALKLVIATWLQDLMAEEYGDPEAVLVPNGVDWAQFQSSPRTKAPVPTVGVVYARQPWKGLDTAFQAMRLAQERCPGLQVLCFGSVPLRTTTALPANLQFTLRPPQEQIPRIYRAADCWVVPSTTEGFGMPGLEAAASHCPVVSTRCGGPQDYVDDGVSGHLVPVGDPRAMARALVDIVTLDPGAWKTMSAASHAIATRFNWDRSAELLENALVAALGRKRSDGGPDDSHRLMPTAGHSEATLNTA